MSAVNHHFVDPVTRQDAVQVGEGDGYGVGVRFPQHLCQSS